MGGSVFLDAASVEALLPPPYLHHHLNAHLPSATASVTSPLRSHFPITPSSSLLLMPSWTTSPALPYLGVKIVTYFPNNSSQHGLPGVHACYSLFDAATGRPLASIDGTRLTLLRTAAISALASRYLARGDSHTFVLVGAGALAAHLVRAHLFVRPSLRRVIIWNRNAQKSRELAETLATENDGVVFECAERSDEAVELGDVVVCATSSEEPVVKGGSLKPGAHLNLIGSFTPTMRECDDEAVARGRLFVDCDAAMEEAGELVGAFRRGVASGEDVAGTLVDLVGGAKVGRKSEEEVTVFKSVGSAVFDLLTAQLAYENYIKEKQEGSPGGPFG